MVNKIVRIIGFLLCLLFIFDFVIMQAYAVTEETYILVSTAKEATDILGKYGAKENETTDTETEKGTAETVENDDGNNREQELVDLSEFLTIICVGTRTERVDSSVEESESTDTEKAYTLQVFSIKGSKPASEWPVKLKTLRAIADKSNKGEFTARLSEEAPTDNITKIGYLVRSTMDRTGCFYIDSENNLYVYFTALSEDDAKSYIDTEDEATEHKTMEGQVDLRELSAEELANLTKIRDELAREQEHSIDTRLLSVADIILNIFGILCIVYAVTMLISYVLDMYNVINTEIEFFNIVTFGRWHIADFADGDILQDTKQFITIPRMLLMVVFTIMIGVLLIAVNWITLAATIYTYLRERG